MRKQQGTKFSLTLLALVVAITLLGVRPSTSTLAQGAATPDASVGALPPEATLILSAYSTPREAFAEIIPAFTADWLKKTGQKVTFQESYAGSGAQSRAIVGGFEADVTALSLEGDVTRIEKAGLITHDWKNTQYKGFFGTSIVIFAVRAGNPKGIKDWADVAKPGIEVITPDPATSGGAQWNLLAGLGAAQRGNVPGYDKGEEGGLKFIGDLVKNVQVYDKDARSSFLNFENGVGDVALTYENELYAGLQAQATPEAGQEAKPADYEALYPSSTILIQNPAAVIDVNVDKHGVRPAAEAFVAYLTTPEAQAILAKHGYRPLDETVAKDPNVVKLFPEVKDLFQIDEFGGWSKVGTDLFGENGKITALINAAQGK
jgi:sulfate/thiosulfate-binding protein